MWAISSGVRRKRGPNERQATHIAPKTKTASASAKFTLAAFERKDNADPAAVTALSVSRDHRTVYVGDEKGRVWSWAVSSKPGKGR